MFRGKSFRALVSASVILLVAGCGGGGSDGGAKCSDFQFQEDAQAAFRNGERQLDGDDDGIACESLPRRPTSPTGPSAPTAPVIVQGLYTGTLTNSTSTQFELLSLENGDVWALYGVPSGALFVVRGFVQGSTVRSGTSVSSSSIKDYGLNPAPTGTLSGTITTSAVSGSIAFSGTAHSFAGSPPTSSSYTYDTPAVLSQVVGSWSLSALDGTATNVTVASNGTFSGTNAGCAISGTVRPRSSGKNVFDVSVLSGPSPCLAPGTTSTGIAITYLLPNSNVRQLIVAGVNSSRTTGNVYFGTR
jgi:hypothetical protein